MEANSDYIIQNAMASGLIKGIQGDQMILEGLGPVDYPSDDTLRAKQQEINSLRVAISQAHVASRPPEGGGGVGFIGGRGGGQGPGLIESQAAAMGQPSANLVVQATSRYEKAQQEYQQLMSIRFEAYDKIRLAARQKAVSYGAR